MNMQKCALLDKEKELRQSHIVPKLFYTYLKKDAGNNPFYSVNGMHRDGYKAQLLCQEAETLLSKYETYFSNKIFRPIVNEKNTEVAYDSHLLIFVVSLIWSQIVSTNLSVYFPLQKNGLTKTVYLQYITEPSCVILVGIFILTKELSLSM